MKRNHRLIVLCLFNVLMMVFATPVMATEKPSAQICTIAAAPQGTCGDGVCDAYTGENKTTCPKDCKSSGSGTQPTVPPPTNTPLPTPSPSATVPALPLVIPTATSQPTQAASQNPSTTQVAIPTSTALPTASAGGPVSSGSGAGCGLVSYESRPLGWQKAYTGKSNNFVPKTADHQEVYVCNVPPDGQICIPMYEGLMSVVQNRTDQIMLVDCGADGSCQTHKAPVQHVGSNLCASVTAADKVSCTTGCAFLPEAYTLLGLPVPPLLRDLLASNAFIPAICLAAIFIFGFVGLLVFARRRRKTDAPTEEAEGVVDHGPGVESV